MKINKFLKFNSRTKNNILVLFLYIFLTLIMTVPVAFQLKTHIPGDADSFQILAKPYRLINLANPEGILSRFDLLKHFFEPDRIYSIFSQLTILHLLLGEPLAYNIFWLSAFILSAFGSYLLVKYLVGDRVAAFIAGIIYGFAPFHTSYSMRFGGGNHIEWIPFFALYLIKYFRKPSLKHLLLSGLFFVMVTANEPHFAAYNSLFALIIIIYYLVNKKSLLKNIKFILYSTVSTILAISFVIWKNYKLICTYFSGNNFLNPGIKQTIAGSADAIDFLVPPDTHLLWGKLFSNITSSYLVANDTDFSIFIGFTTIFFIILSLIYKVNKFKKFWFLTALIFYIMALGPFLNFMGLIKPMIPMPYLLIYEYIPFFNNVRAVGRAFIISILSFSVLAAYGIKYFREKYSQNIKSKLVIPIFITFFIVIEFLVIPLDTISTKIPDFYLNLAKEDDAKILQIPGSTNYLSASKNLYYEGVHKKETINEMDFARRIPNRLDFQRNTPVINTLLYSLPLHGSLYGDIITHPYNENANDILNYYKINYITIDKEYIGNERNNMSAEISPKSYIKIKNFINDNNIGKLYFEDKAVAAYKISSGAEAGSCYLEMGDGWDDLHVTSDDKWRNLNKKGSINVINTSEKTKEIKIELTARSNNKTAPVGISASLNNTDYTTYYVGTTNTVLVWHLKDIKPGTNNLRFDVKPVETDYFFDHSKDSALVSNISYSTMNNIDSDKLLSQIINDHDDFSILQIPYLNNYPWVSDDNLSQSGKNLFSVNDLIRDKESINIYGDDFDKNVIYDKMPIVKDALGINNNDPHRYHEAFDNKYYEDELVKTVLTKYRIKYIMLRTDLLPEEKKSSIVEYWKNNLNLEVVHEDNTNLLLKFIHFSQTNNKSIIPIMVGKNWGSTLSAGDGRHFVLRPFSKSILALNNPHTEDKIITLKFRAWSCAKNKGRTIKLSLNNAEIGKYFIDRNQTHIVQALTIRPGTNKLSLDVYNDQGQLITSNDRHGKTCTINLIDLELEQ